MRCPNYCLAAACLLALAACATQYRPRSVWNIGGYSETRIAPDTFRVSFDGNELLLPDQSADFARLRAAELCLAERKAFMQLSQFSNDLEMLPGLGRFVTKPKDASSDTSGRNEYSEAAKRTVYVPAQPRYRAKSYVTVACIDQEATNAVNAAALADSIRTRYRLARS